MSANNILVLKSCCLLDKNSDLESVWYTCIFYKNASGDEIANVNFYAVCLEATRICWNNAK